MDSSSSSERLRKPRGRHPDRRLTAATVRRIGPGRHADGNGLYLEVDRNGARRWFLRTMVHGQRRDIGLGGLSLVSLAGSSGSSRAPAQGRAGGRRSLRRAGSREACLAHLCRCSPCCTRHPHRHQQPQRQARSPVAHDAGEVRFPDHWVEAGPCGRSGRCPTGSRADLD
jgi:hypothetical protein